MNKQTETNETADAGQNCVTYTLSDCGCYVDGTRGTYAIDKIEDVARDHGYKLPNDISDQAFVTLSDCDFASWIEDEIDDYMNTHFGVEGAYWGRNENGDWGLWAIESDEQPDDPTSLENSDETRRESASL